MNDKDDARIESQLRAAGDSFRTKYAATGRLHYVYRRPTMQESHRSIVIRYALAGAVLAVVLLMLLPDISGRDRSAGEYAPSVETVAFEFDDESLALEGSQLLVSYEPLIIEPEEWSGYLENEDELYEES